MVEYLSSYYHSPSGDAHLTLQHVIRKRKKLPILFACLTQDRGDCIETNRNAVYKYLSQEKVDTSHKEGLFEQLTEWFHTRALEICQGGNPERVLEQILKSLLREFSGSGADFAAVFCIGRECVYLWRGSVNLYVLNRIFDRRHMEKLTRYSRQIQYEYAQMEDIGLLLCGELFEKIPRQIIQDCLIAENFIDEKKLKRNLTELCETAGRYGEEDVSAICLLVREK